MVNVEYIGSKPIKTDNVANTKTVWNGPGDVQAVPAAVWDKLKAHPLVWRAVDIQPDPAPITLQDAEPAAEQPSEQDEQDEDKPLPIPLDHMTAEQLHQYAKDRGVTLDRRVKDPAKLRATLDAMAKA